MLKHLLVMAVSLFTIVGCGADLPSKHDLTTATLAKHIVIAEDRQYTHPEHPQWIYHIKAGTYSAKLSNAEGTFFQGPENCIRACDLQERCSLMPVEGGIWYPAEGIKKRPRLYWIVKVKGDEAALKNAGVIETLMLMAFNGDVNFVADDVSDSSILTEMAPH